jgi:putative heme-binding domain-containing protein
MERIVALVAADELPSEEERSRLRQMSFDELAEYLEYDVTAYEGHDPERGERVFRRARCAACHVFGDVGRGGGPDLSTVVSRFRRREILESIVYPSRVISDQYGAYRVELRDGQSYVGMHAAESEQDLTLITATGERLVLDKLEIVSREIAHVSLMPEGLLEAMSFDDLVSLMRYLEEGGD